VINDVSLVKREDAHRLRVHRTTGRSFVGSQCSCQKHVSLLVWISLNQPPNAAMDGYVCIDTRTQCISSTLSDTVWIIDNTNSSNYEIFDSNVTIAVSVWCSWKTWQWLPCYLSTRRSAPIKMLTVLKNVMHWPIFILDMNLHNSEFDGCENTFDTPCPLNMFRPPLSVCWNNERLLNVHHSC